MKRKPKIHLMAEHNHTQARCGAIVSVLRLTDVASEITCLECLPSWQQKKVIRWLENQEAFKDS